jgi:hypothetical protein
MNIGNLSKTKYSSNVVINKNLKTKEIKDVNAKIKSISTIDKETVGTPNNIRSGLITMVTANKYKTTKNSRKNIFII